MKAILFAGVLAVGALLGGCGAVGNAIDCHGICGRYQTCYDSKYDTSACEKRCRDNANSDSNYMQKSDACKACLDNNADCAASSFKCGVQCAGITP